MISEDSTTAKLKARMQRWQSYVQVPEEAKGPDAPAESFATAQAEIVSDALPSGLLMLSDGRSSSRDFDVDEATQETAYRTEMLPHLPPVFTPSYTAYTQPDEEIRTADYIRHGHADSQVGTAIPVGTIRRLPANGFAATQSRSRRGEHMGIEFPVNQAVRINDAPTNIGRMAIWAIFLLAVAVGLFVFIINM